MAPNSKSIAFLKSKEYKLISKFAKSYKKKYNYFSKDSKNDDKSIEKKLDKLKKSLEKKGFVFKTKELRQFIYNEIIVLSYESFKNKISHFKPKSLNDYITAFLKVFREDYKEFIIKNLRFPHNYHFLVENLLKDMTTGVISIDDAINQAKYIKKAVKVWFLRIYSNIEIRYFVLIVLLFEGIDIKRFEQIHKKIISLLNQLIYPIFYTDLIENFYRTGEDLKSFYLLSLRSFYIILLFIFSFRSILIKKSID